MLVVQDKHLCFQILYLGSGKLLAVHEEGAVPINVNNHFLWPALCACMILVFSAAGERKAGICQEHHGLPYIHKFSTAPEHLLGS
jgi:hypothetical protein